MCFSKVGALSISWEATWRFILTSTRLHCCLFLPAARSHNTHFSCCLLLFQMFESQLLQVQDKLSQVFVDKFEQLQCGVDALNERISLVEREFTIERDKQAREAEEKNATITNDLTTLQVFLTIMRTAFISFRLCASRPTYLSHAQSCRLS